MSADRFFEWLLSDAPMAAAERARRRAAWAANEARSQAEVDRLTERLLADPAASQELRRVAVIARRVLDRRVARHATELGIDDADWVRAERHAYSVSRRVAGEHDYRYPTRYLGAAAAAQPIPVEPVERVGRSLGNGSIQATSDRTHQRHLPDLIQER